MWGLLFCLAGAAVGADEPRPASAIPPKATVVLLAGLPGDGESETQYRDQLLTWLGVLGPAAPERVFILCNAPEDLPVSSRLPVKLLPAGQQEFLKLGKRLAGQTNPLVVIAWGQGGVQGKFPVFPLRESGLMVEDFKFFAGQAQAESRWILYFRGSGRFAAKLAAENRGIISSEKETMFVSDPIGMPLLLQALRAKPALSFEALGEELGRATAAWYVEHKRPIAEEPTLWQGTTPPRPLIPSEKSQTPGPNTQAGQAGKSSATNTAPAELPLAWKGIVRVDPQKFPGEGAVILRQRLSYTLRSSPAIDTEHEEFIQVLTAEGKHFGDFDLSYASQAENLTFRDCEVLRPDGRLVRLEPNEIVESEQEALGDFRQVRRLFFSLPGIEPGAIIHFRYYRARSKYSLPHISLEIPLAAKVPVEELNLQVTTAKDMAFHFDFARMAPTNPAIDKAMHGTTYSWRWQHLPAHPQEALSLPDDMPALQLSTFPDWAAFARWYAGIIEQTDEITPEIAAKAAELTRAAKTDQEKILACYNYVTGLRYVSVPLGINSIRPHAAAKVLKNQFGDCKDKATLFNTLLRSLDLEARLVLVPRFRQAHDALPGLAFNHAISRVKLGGDVLWVDTTDDVCRFGMLPPGDPGRNVLVIDGKTDVLTRLPDPSPKDHALTLRAKVDCPVGADEAPVAWKATALGYADYELRSAAQGMKARQKTQPLLAMKYHLAAGAFAMDQQSFTPVSALSEDFIWQAQGRCLGILAPAADQTRLRAPFWLPDEFDVALHQRKTPLFLAEGYPLTLEEEIEFALPAQAHVRELPAPRANPDPPLRWQVEWKQTAPAILTARFHAELTHGELSGAETAALQKQLRALVTALAAGAAIAP